MLIMFATFCVICLNKRHKLKPQIFFCSSFSRGLRIKGGISKVKKKKKGFLFFGSRELKPFKIIIVLSLHLIGILIVI